MCRKSNIVRPEKVMNVTTRRTKKRPEPKQHRRTQLASSAKAIIDKNRRDAQDLILKTMARNILTQMQN